MTGVYEAPQAQECLLSIRGTSKLIKTNLLFQAAWHPVFSLMRSVWPSKLCIFCVAVNTLQHFPPWIISILIVFFILLSRNFHKWSLGHNPIYFCRNMNDTQTHLTYPFPLNFENNNPSNGWIRQLIHAAQRTVLAFISVSHCWIWRVLYCQTSLS